MTSEPEPLRLSPEAAERCVEACTKYRTGLDDLRRYVAGLDRIDSFGTLESARVLGAKFGALLNNGEGSVLVRIEQHIDVADQMIESFRAAGRAYEETDADTAAAITRAGN